MGGVGVGQGFDVLFHIAGIGLTALIFIRAWCRSAHPERHVQKFLVRTYTADSVTFNGSRLGLPARIHDCNSKLYHCKDD